MSSQPHRDQANDDQENGSQLPTEPEQDSRPDILPRGVAQQSATGTGSIKVSG